jgi:hypothetical protein
MVIFIHIASIYVAEKNILAVVFLFKKNDRQVVKIAENSYHYIDPWASSLHQENKTAGSKLCQGITRKQLIHFKVAIIMTNRIHIVTVMIE